MGQVRPPEHKQTTFNSGAGVKGEKYQTWITCPRTELVQQCESEAAVPCLKAKWDAISKLLCLGSSQAHSPSVWYMALRNRNLAQLGITLSLHVGAVTRGLVRGWQCSWGYAGREGFVCVFVL